MLLILIIANFAIKLLYGLLISLLMLTTAGIAKINERVHLGKIGLSLFIVPDVIISIGLQVYFWVLWASFCAFNVLYFIDSNEVTHKWLYYATGFLTTATPMNYFSIREEEIVNSYKEKKRIRRYSGFYILISIIAFSVLCYYPELMRYKIISLVNDLFISF